MGQNKRARPLAGDRSSENVLADGFDGSEHNYKSVNFQQTWLCRNFGLEPIRAVLIAELAFGSGGAV